MAQSATAARSVPAPAQKLVHGRAAAPTRPRPIKAGADSCGFSPGLDALFRLHGLGVDVHVSGDVMLIEMEMPQPIAGDRKMLAELKKELEEEQ